eukprot:5188352-Prymnesium_polylepis.1
MQLVRSRLCVFVAARLLVAAMAEEAASPCVDAADAELGKMAARHGVEIESCIAAAQQGLCWAVATACPASCDSCQHANSARGRQMATPSKPPPRSPPSLPSAPPPSSPPRLPPPLSPSPASPRPPSSPPSRPARSPSPPPPLFPPHYPGYIDPLLPAHPPPIIPAPACPPHLPPVSPPCVSISDWVDSSGQTCTGSYTPCHSGLHTPNSG